jgi:hypothetical protein
MTYINTQTNAISFWGADAKERYEKTRGLALFANDLLPEEKPDEDCNVERFIGYLNEHKITAEEFCSIHGRFMYDHPGVILSSKTVQALADFGFIYTARSFLFARAHGKDQDTIDTIKAVIEKQGGENHEALVSMLKYKRFSIAGSFPPKILSIAFKNTSYAFISEFSDSFIPVLLDLTTDNNFSKGGNYYESLMELIFNQETKLAEIILKGKDRLNISLFLRMILNTNDPESLKCVLNIIFKNKLENKLCSYFDYKNDTEGCTLLGRFISSLFESFKPDRDAVASTEPDRNKVKMMKLLLLQPNAGGDFVPVDTKEVKVPLDTCDCNAVRILREGLSLLTGTICNEPLDTVISANRCFEISPYYVGKIYRTALSEIEEQQKFYKERKELHAELYKCLDTLPNELISIIVDHALPEPPPSDLPRCMKM